jgi:aminoglycoside phosphotransferase (APT) family kinase protein
VAAEVVMHKGELPVDARLVRRLVTAQVPRLAHLPLEELVERGTMNAIYRLGAEHCVRLPRLERWSGVLERELLFLPRLAPHLPLVIPEPVVAGVPSADYPSRWAVYRWIEGRAYGDAEPADERAAARRLARFVRALRDAPPWGDAPATGRAPLVELDTVTRAALEAAADEIDAAAAAAAWQRALDAPAWDGRPVWLHGDLLRSNLLVSKGRLAAALDFGSVGRGDPAADITAAWSVFGPRGRRAYRAALDVDDGTWERARGYALHQAALIVPYYRHTQPRFAQQARRTLAELVSDA